MKEEKKGAQKHEPAKPIGTTPKKPEESKKPAHGKPGVASGKPQSGKPATGHPKQH